MAILPIILAPDPVLRKTAQPIELITADILTLLEDMAETMYAAPGVGLAANQVGRLDRVIVMDCADDEDTPEVWKMINPEIISQSEDIAKREEGCLSLPDFKGDVERPCVVMIRYLDIKGEQREMSATGLLATCVQHEIDHLNGVLFIDHLTRLKRDMIWRKVVKNASDSK